MRDGGWWCGEVREGGVVWRSERGGGWCGEVREGGGKKYVV